MDRLRHRHSDRDRYIDPEPEAISCTSFNRIRILRSVGLLRSVDRRRDSRLALDTQDNKRVDDSQQPLLLCGMAAIQA